MGIYRIPEDRQIIIDECILRADTDGTAYIRDVADYKNLELPYNEAERIAHKIAESGDYLLSVGQERGFFIYKNGNKKLTDSVIATNKSVSETNDAIKINFKSQSRVSTWALILTSVSIAFIGITAYLQYQDKTDEAVRQLRKEVQETSKSLKLIESSLQGIIHSIQNINADTTLVRVLKK